MTNKTITVFLPKGHELELTTDEFATGSYVLISNPGDEPSTPVSIAANIHLHTDTFNDDRFYRIVSETGEIQYDVMFTGLYKEDNTTAYGQTYMQSNATETTVALVDTWYKVAGTTSPSPENVEFDQTNNRLTCTTESRRHFKLSCTVSFSTTANNIIDFAIYDSRLGTVRTPSIMGAKANSAGRVESVTVQCAVFHKDGDYLEIHVRNQTGANDVTVEYFNFIAHEID
jgi:hypothetical protein